MVPAKAEGFRQRHLSTLTFDTSGAQWLRAARVFYMKTSPTVRRL
jgi:hypothetical protein